MALLGVLAGILGVVAIGAWIVAVMSALSIVQLAPAGQKMSIWFTLGWWRFDKIRTVTGPAADPHIKRYVRAFLVFFAAILVAMGIGIAVTFTAQNEPAEEQQATEPERINDPRVIAVRTANALPDSTILLPRTLSRLA
jgi:hypothetical protein